MNRRRKGFVIGLLVFASLAMISLAVYPMLFFSGSQTRSEGSSLARWRARGMARAGLQVASNRLHRDRWYGGGSETSTGSDLAPFMTGTLSSADLGLDGPDGSFTILCESIVGRPRPRSPTDPTEFTPLHHVDVFVRGRSGDESVVAYGAFLVFPDPPIGGRSTGGAGATRRLVRITYFGEPRLQDVTDPTVRTGIRTAFTAQSARYLENYRTLDLSAAPSPLGTGVTDVEAQAFLERFLRTPPADWTPEATFLRDRFHDLVLEGTPVAMRSRAIWHRGLDAGVQSCQGRPEVDAARLFCTQVSSCTWVDPACLTPERWDLGPDDPGAAGARHAIDKLHELRGGVPDSGYLTRLSTTEPIIRDYSFSCAETFASGTDPADLPAGAFQNPLDGGRWCSGPTASIGPPAGTVNYYLCEDLGASLSPGGTDVDVCPTGTVLAPVSEVFELMRRYYALEEGAPWSDAEVRGWVGSSPPGGSGGSGGGSGGGGGGGGFGGGFSG